MQAAEAAVIISDDDSEPEAAGPSGSALRRKVRISFETPASSMLATRTAQLGIYVPFG